MLEDRDYMRQPEYAPSVSMTVVLLIVNAVIFLVECLFSPHPLALMPSNEFIYNYFALSLDGLKHGYVWQLLTYQFMHASLWHIVANSFAIYFFGRELEIMLGWKKYLTLFFSSGIVGGVFQILTAIVWPQIFGGSTVGASAGAFGLIAAFAAIYPDRELTLLLFFIIPIKMRARTLLIGSAVIALMGVVFSKSIFGGHVANAAHLGGMAMGLFYVFQVLQGRWFHFKNPLRREQPREAVTTRASENKFWRSAPDKEEIPTADFLQNQVDPILDKISAHGIQSLTAREREILESARKKMTRS